MELHQVASRFPLAPRPRPTGKRLADRITGLLETAHEAAEHTRSEALTAAARVHNQAALIASDAGLPTMARRLCWQHAELYLPVLPVDAATARSALEPVVNLARLAIRDGDGLGAWRLLESLATAVAGAVPIEVDERRLPADLLVATAADRQEITRWLWTVRLADGLRALATAGRWDQAAEQARRTGGVGGRLFDGRQTVILAALMTGDHQAALHTVAETTIYEPWEAAVQSCLELLCRLAAGLSTRNGPEEVIRYWQELPEQPELIMFRTRVGLTAVDLAEAAGGPDTTRVATRLADNAVAAADGYAARDILTSHRDRLPRTHTTALETVLHTSGLDAGAIPDTLMPTLTTALETSRNTMTQILGTGA